MDKSWMNVTDRLKSPAYEKGIYNFLTMAINHSMGSDRIRCPCRRCCNNLFLPIFEVESHLFIKGINPNYTRWIFHGEEEILPIIDDNDDPRVNAKDEYIDNMDIRVGTFEEVPKDNIPLPTQPSIAQPSSNSTFDQLLEDAQCPLFNGPGDSMGDSGRGRPRGRGSRARRLVPYSCQARRPRGAIINSYHNPGDADEASSDDSIQPPSIPWEPPCANPIPKAEPITEPSPIRELEPNREEIGEDAPAVPVVNQAQRRRGRGPAKCTEFEKLRKYGKVLLKINNGETAPCCENASMFTTRVTWIVKHHCDMSYPRWSDVPQAHKDELVDCVRDDFEFDWDLENHRLTVMKQLRKRFNAFHHELHKIYLSHGSHDEALAAGTSLVDPLVWVKLCGRWGSEAFKKLSSQNRENRKRLNINHTAGCKSFVRILEQKRAEKKNLVEIYKDTHWSKKNDKFVTPAAEDAYKEMVGKLDTLEPEKRTDEAAAIVFREVLGHRPGYARGLGEMVIPESTRRCDLERDKECITLVEKHKKDAESYKSQLEEMRADMRLLLERQNEINKMLRTFFNNFPSQTESLEEIQ